MTERDKLIDILMSKPYGHSTYEEFADYLLANGVTVPICKVGDTVYAYYSTREYTTIRGKKRRENKQIYTNHLFNLAMEVKSLEIRDKRCTKGDLLLLGRLVFATREAAEKALWEVRR